MLFLLRIYKKIEFYVNYFLRLEADSKVLSVYRIVFSCVGFIYAYNNILHIDLMTIGFEYHYNIKVYHIANYCLLLLLFLINMGKAVIWFKIIHWLLAAYIINNGFPYSAENYLYLLSAFWIIFVNINSHYNILSQNNASGKVKAWPVYFFFMSLAGNFISAGLSKLLDPIWLHGLGIKYFFSLGWNLINVPNSISIPDSLFTLTNYCVILFEISILLFFLIPKLRKISIVMVFTFFSLLTFPFRLDMIGPIGLSMCICFTSITRFKK